MISLTQSKFRFRSWRLMQLFFTQLQKIGVWIKIKILKIVFLLTRTQFCDFLPWQLGELHRNPPWQPYQLGSHYTNYDHTIPTVIRDVATNHRAGANWSHKTDTELPQRRFPSFQWSTTLVNYSAKLTYWRLIKLSLTKAGKLVSLELLMSLFESSASFDLFHNDFNQSFVSTLGTWRRKSVSNNLFGAPHYLFLDHF